MARRKPWDELSPDYRRRLERHGITAEKHSSGARIEKARGKKSRTYEREYSKERRTIQRFIDRMQDYYGRDEEDIREVIADYGLLRVSQAADLQRQMQELYEDGYIEAARRLWETRDIDLPEWMHYYHGGFSGR